jgi:hypothetical protein
MEIKRTLPGGNDRILGWEIISCPVFGIDTDFYNIYIIGYKY